MAVVWTQVMKPYFEDDAVTIYHADCRDILPSLGPVDLVLTDPPYGLGAARRNFSGGGVRRHMTGLVAGKAIPKRDYGDAAWDDVPAEQATIDALRNLSTWQIIFGGNYFVLPPARCWLVWDKLRGDTDYADAELAWTNLDRTVRVKRFRWNGFLQEHSGRDKEQRWHPTQKPVFVTRWAVEQAPAGVATILDPFMGSGTTLRAAKDLGRKAIGIEIEERYCEIAAKRMAQSVMPLEVR
jgi:DNA modification methylase